MRILPELEAYRDRLIERATGWPEAPDDELLRDLNQCLEQMSLLEKGIAALKRQLEKTPPAKAPPRETVPAEARHAFPGRQDDAERAKPAEMSPEPDEVERMSHRLAIQQQTYELTAAYVTVLRLRIAGRAS